MGNAIAHTVIKSLVLYTPVPIPKERPAAPELDQTRSGTMPSDFAADVR
ncbi:MAG TPA: hypothetical protein VJU87_09245 [Gemmatimonadaceae bacterium]|nr:hypothetical protein [Gemmatimonadaceae bacterium]